ncbi:TIGR02757 family protein [Flavihumibacter fluvii]|uniref:TIGR02757 family protein n=1 Tax=Flavihumibacter fluvii TaxID=2838157 RepID=UPI001BDEC98F|nr:TIGR02757 family protein [Flavihumibacter fluvii]ULQ51859.1 TIGR02757 family protein [Flavihumibacter fluvii]
MQVSRQNIIDFLNRKVLEYDQPRFIPDDPVCIPHQFSQPADIEIAGLFAAIFAWGNRTTIINKSRELMALMGNSPHAFVLHHSPADLKRLVSFKHRTFTATDLLYFIDFLQRHYQQYPSLESAFLKGLQPGDQDTTGVLNGFHHYFFSGEDVPPRTRKHIAAPFKNSTCKRLSMYLRWMVRQDPHGVDFGLWRGISPSQLVCPIDVHVARVARRFNLLQREAIDWKAALELTSWLRKLDPIDPVKYDFALFALGIVEKY